LDGDGGLAFFDGGDFRAVIRLNKKEAVFFLADREVDVFRGVDGTVGKTDGRASVRGSENGLHVDGAFKEYLLGRRANLDGHFRRGNNRRTFPKGHPVNDGTVGFKGRDVVRGRRRGRNGFGRGSRIRRDGFRRVGKRRFVGLRGEPRERQDEEKEGREGFHKVLHDN
jgi:hypothetical protein